MSQNHLWSTLSLVAPLGARVVGQAPIGVSGVSIDTRTLARGELYIAIRGDTHDGHAFVRDAFAKGAAACVVDEAHARDLRDAGPLFVVRDTLRAMEGLGRAARQRSRAWIAAVTGSVGKTSTKEAMRVVLSRFGETHASAASYNNHWGVPLTLARMPASASFGVFEIGMNNAGEITPLVGMVRPHVAVVTAVAPVHLENLGTLEAIADAKAEIFSGLEPGGTAIVNAHAPHLDRLKAAAMLVPDVRLLSFGEEEGVDARLVSFANDADGSLVEAEVLGRRLRFRIGAPGRHMAFNALAVLLTASSLGCDVEAAAEALADFAAPAGRGQQFHLRLDGGSLVLIDEAYNANPVSMRAALALLGQAPLGSEGRRIAALGDMLELGPEAARLHVEVAQDIEANGVDLVFCAGPLMKGLFDALPGERKGAWAPAASGIESALLGAIRPGDAVMVKGSNGSRMGPIVAAIRKHAAASPADEVSEC